MARFGLRALLIAVVALPQPLPVARRAAAGAEALAPIAVVANVDVPAERLDEEEVRRVFLLRRRFWSNGSRVHPVNLPATAPVREQFSRSILGRSPRDLADYFNDLYFHGTPPPPVLESERAVLLYVERTRGAVGYVSLAALGAGRAVGVKVLFTTE
jgi:hypothetical protein